MLYFLVISKITIGYLSDFKKSDSISSFIDDVLSEVKYEYDDYDYLMKLLNDKKYKTTNYNKLVIQLIKPQVLSYFLSENFEYLEGKFKKNLPNFYSKYKDTIKFELDNTLKRGIEFSNKSYFNDLNDLIEMINLFYSDFNNQKYSAIININHKFNSKNTLNAGANTD